MRSRSAAIVFALLLSPLASGQVHAPVGSSTAPLGDADFKQVAAPPSDVTSGLLRLPEPDAVATRSRAALVRVEFTRSSTGEWSFDTRVPVPATGPATFALLVPDTADFALDVRGPLGGFAAVERVFGASGVERRTDVLDAEFAGWRTERFDVREFPSGTWTFRVRATNASSRPAPSWFAALDRADYTLAAYTSTLATVTGSDVAILARVEDAAGVAQLGVVRALDAVVETAFGTRRLALADDGAHGDGGAADGVFGAWLPRGTSGDVRARVELDGVTPGGASFARGAQLTFPMVEPRTSFTGVVTTNAAADGRTRIELGALPLAPAAKLHVSAEVWGTDASGALVPVCWLSRMLVPEVSGGAWKLALLLDERWSARAGAGAPFVLRNARVQDPDTHVPFDTADVLPLPISAPVPSGPTALRLGPALLMAPAGQPVEPPSGEETQPGVLPRTLLLVHGYCSSGTIWPAADFTAPKQEFLDPNQNRTHDQFALLLRQSVPARNSFGVVAHSQGGAAALHLYTYYVSGLDRALGARRIQSVASPYQGTPLASLGGFSCGVNNDMTPAGAATWLAGIPTWARAQVWYWTTSNSGSACNFFSNLVLGSPNDGTVEQARGQLPGANSMGHVTGWCHTTGMTNPANYTDHARNASMNTNAAR